MAHMCPWWLGYFLISPLRKITQNPDKIVAPYLKPGMKVLEVGPGMGFFSLSIAKQVGQNGRVYCIDLQEKMLSALKKRAAKVHVDSVINTRLCSTESLDVQDLQGQINFALAFAVCHEVPDKAKLFKEIYDSLKAGGQLLISEPIFHVRRKAFDATVKIALDVGFSIFIEPKIPKGHSVLLKK